MEESSGILQKFKKENPTFFKQPIVKSFFDVEENIVLLKKHLDGDKNSSILLDEKFKYHFYRARIVNYISNLIYYFSVDYDKKVNLTSNRYPLLLNNTSGVFCNRKVHNNATENT